MDSLELTGADTFLTHGCDSQSVEMNRSPAWGRHCRHSVCIALLVSICQSQSVSADWITIDPPLVDNQLILIVGPEANPTAPGPVEVTFNIAEAQLGNGTAVDGSPRVHVQVGFRRHGQPTGATLTVTGSTPEANPIPNLGWITWTSGAVASAPTGTPVLPSGALAAGVQTLYRTLVVPDNNSESWAAGLFTFHYANSQFLAAGTYTARMEFTATRP